LHDAIENDERECDDLSHGWIFGSCALHPEDERPARLPTTYLAFFVHGISRPPPANDLKPFRQRRREADTASPDEPTGRANARPMTSSAMSGSFIPIPACRFAHEGYLLMVPRLCAIEMCTLGGTGHKVSVGNRTLHHNASIALKDHNNARSMAYSGEP
jgi:hypothetical protein